MLKFKDTVRLGPFFTAHLAMALVLTDQIYADVGAAECTITSIHDSEHSAKSKHYFGRAADIRSKTLTADQKTIVLVRLKARLAPLGFDVLLEDRDGPNEHLHIEWDPKELPPAPVPA